MSLLLRVLVHSADIQDRYGALLVSSRLAVDFPRLLTIRADGGGYAGRLVSWVLTTLCCLLIIIKRSDTPAGFQLFPRRWVVERTFAWLGGFQRLSKDDEQLPRLSETFIHIAMNHIVIRLSP